MKELVSIDPKTQKKLKVYSQTSEAELEKALSMSHNAFNHWKFVDFEKKKAMFQNLAKQLEKEKQSIAQMAVDEMGKPLNQAISEVEKCKLACEYYIETAESSLSPRTIDTDAGLSMVYFQPLGCILSVMPWNFPYWQVLRCAIPAIMSGNVVLLKHASNVSGCALMIENLFKNAGFPDSIFKTLLISSDRVETLISDFRVKGVSLTGSTEAGRKVAELAGKHLKKLVLELGGSDPYIVLEDADVDLAAEICMKSRLQNNGQSCIAAKRFIVLEKVYDEFKTKIIKFCEDNVNISSSTSLIELGPQARLDLKQGLEEQVNLAVKSGAKVFYQGDFQDQGAFYPVTLIENIEKSNPAYAQEFFGPVALLFKVKSVDEAVGLANDTPFGLGAAVFSQDVKAATELAAHQINAGSCFVNSMVKSNPKLPFGGINDSGYGRELSEYGLFEFINVKTVSIS